ncbi:hypothetical protein HDU99_010721 [Rhizoclosmatium hyalinum]|nr:hypothetical protein HDU99_010721 [Rhizoclosmatium hyalinum]
MTVPHQSFAATSSSTTGISNATTSTPTSTAHNTSSISSSSTSIPPSSVPTSNSQAAPAPAPAKRFKNSHHLVLQRKPRSKKKVALMMRQHRLMEEVEEMTREGKLVEVTVCNKDPKHENAGGSSQNGSEKSSRNEDESGAAVQNSVRVQNGKQQEQQHPPDHEEEENDSFDDESDEEHEEKEEEVGVVGDSQLLKEAAAVVSDLPPPAIPYAKHSYNAAELVCISKSTSNELSIGMLVDLSTNLQAGWLASPPPRNTVPGYSSRLSGKKTPKTVSLNPWQYDLAPSVIANLQISLSRSPSPVIRPATTTATPALTNHSVPHIHSLAGKSQQHQPSQHFQSSSMLKPVQPFSKGGGAPNSKNNQIVPPQSYPFMRNLNPSIPTIIKHHNASEHGAHKFMTEVFASVSKPVRKAQTPPASGSFRYSDRKQAQQQKTLVFPVLPPTSSTTNTSSNSASLASSPGNPTATLRQFLQSVTETSNQPAINGYSSLKQPTSSLKLPQASVTTLTDGSPQTSFILPISGADSLSRTLSHTNMRQTPSQITKWASDKDLPIASYEYEVIHKSNQQQQQQPFFESGEGNYTGTAPPFAVNAVPAATSSSTHSSVFHSDSNHFQHEFDGYLSPKPASINWNTTPRTTTDSGVNGGGRRKIKVNKQKQQPQGMVKKAILPKGLVLTGVEGAVGPVASIPSKLINNAHGEELEVINSSGFDWVQQSVQQQPQLVNRAAFGGSGPLVVVEKTNPTIQSKQETSHPDFLVHGQYEQYLHQLERAVGNHHHHQYHHHKQKSLLMEPTVSIPVVPHIPPPNSLTASSSYLQQHLHDIASTNHIITGGTLLTPLPLLQPSSAPQPSTLAIQNSKKTWRYTPTLRAKSSSTTSLPTRPPSTTATLISSVVASASPRKGLGFDRENEEYIEKKRKAGRVREYAMRVRTLAAAAVGRLEGSKAKREKSVQDVGEGLTVEGGARRKGSRGSEKSVEEKEGGKKDPALEKREKMLSYAAKIKKPTLSKAAGISAIPSGTELPPLLQSTDSGVDLQALTELHANSMKVVEGIKREMGLC